MSTTETPDLPRLVLRVGVTGHRDDNLRKMDPEKLRGQLNKIFESLKSAMSGVHKDSDDSYSRDSYAIRIISPLAEGADRIVAEEAIKHGFELQSPLPFFLERASDNFGKPEAKTDQTKQNGGESLLKNSSAILEMDGSIESKEIAYQSAGRMVLRQSDILIAIWDSQEARGQGGTAQIVNEAKQLAIPTIWIYSENNHPVSLFIPNGERESQQASIEKLEHVIRDILLPESEHSHTHTASSKDHSTQEPDFRCEYLEENISGIHGGFVWGWFRRLVLTGANIPKAKDSDWKEALHGLSDEARNQLQTAIEKIDRQILQNYQWADKLAKYYSDLYHSGFVANYIMSGLAVLFAFLSFGLHIPAWNFAELAVILAIYLIYRADSGRLWHHRRIDYRLLAEMLRQTRFLAAIGRFAPLAPPQPIHAHYGDPSGSWVQWHYRAILRQLGIVTARFQHEYLLGVGRMVEIDTQNQASYHARKAQMNFAIAHRLHAAAVACFILAAFACLLHVVFATTPDSVLSNIAFYEKYEHSIHLILSGISIVSPAFGAAFAAIKSQGEFERVARHSVAMAEYLEEAAQDLSSYLQKSQIESAELAGKCEEVADRMIEEVLDWRIVFHKRPIELG